MQGNPKVEKNLVRALIRELVVILRSGIASGNQVAAHIIVSRYSFPLFVFGNGPKQSMITLSKRTPVTGIGCKGTSGIT